MSTTKKAKGWPSKLYEMLEKTGIVSYSGKKNVYGLHPLIISALVIIFTLLIVNLLRKLIKLVLKENIVREIILEFIATAELCACCFELIIVADNYGVHTYAIFLFLLTMWWSSVWDSATACPYNPVENFLDGSKTIKNALMVILAQILGGLTIFQYVQLIWGIELAETHRGRVKADCIADLAVPMQYGLAIEGIATFLCRIFSKVVSYKQIRYASIFDAFFGTSLVVAAFNYTGGYFNPALATSLKFGCEGNTFVEHMLVYWVGATAGSIASVYFCKLAFAGKDQTKEKES